MLKQEYLVQEDNLLESFIILNDVISTMGKVESKKNNKKCIICGCSDHSVFGCFSHWTGHKKNEGMCQKR